MPPTPRSRQRVVAGDAPQSADADTPLVVGPDLQPDETSLDTQDESGPQSDKKMLRVHVPFVWFRREVARDDIPDQMRLVELQAFDGQLIDPELLYKGERERLLNLKSNGFTPDVTEEDAGAFPLPPQSRRMVGIATGPVAVEHAAVATALARMRGVLEDQGAFRPGDPEYEVVSRDPVPGSAELQRRVPAGPGGYNTDVIQAANPS